MKKNNEKKVAIKKIDVKSINKDFEILEDAITPSWGINCRKGSFGIWCN
ncbi:hypothetical protein [Vagococcus hydrophili]|uniref:Uncharacterized protein n=1 Tax=Vagococcus hydrophili TaxID=2714947 RepID=A0A6G8AUS1_9ENTE|nr:hypothetical protein [Vagococcus hydrophili]QIL48737.1 hypothetical protein G7082_09580 [Vagococcus hydrophili]